MLARFTCAEVRAALAGSAGSVRSPDLETGQNLRLWRSRDHRPTQRDVPRAVMSRCCTIAAVQFVLPFEFDLNSYAELPGHFAPCHLSRRHIRVRERTAI